LEELEAEVGLLREWVASLHRRVEEIEANAFFLEEVEEVVVLAVPKKTDY